MLPLLDCALHVLAGGYCLDQDADPDGTSLRTQVQFVTTEAMERAFGAAHVRYNEGPYGGYNHEWLFSDIRTGFVFTVYDRAQLYRVGCLSSVPDRDVAAFLDWLHAMLRSGDA